MVGTGLIVPMRLFLVLMDEPDAMACLIREASCAALDARVALSPQAVELVSAALFQRLKVLGSACCLEQCAHHQGQDRETQPEECWPVHL